MGQREEEALLALQVKLKSRGLRITEPRRKVVREILLHGGHFDPEELASRLREQGVSRATVYRTLSLLEELGMIRKVIFGERHSHFEWVHSSEHHDHLICLRCGKVVEFQSPEIERLQERVARAHGFEILSHTLEIRGLCPNCRKGGRQSGPRR